MKRSFADNAVLITGGGSGIGLALAGEFLRQRAAVMICGRDRAKLDAATEALPALHALPCDVTCAEDRARLLDAVRERFGRLDVLVNNAGVYGRHYIFDDAFDPSEAQRIMLTNFAAPIQLAREALPLLRQSAQPLIVNVTSGLAYAPLPRAPLYSASKAALHFFTSAAGRQRAPFPIRFAEVLPPVVDTAMAQHAQIFKMPVDKFARKTMCALRKGRREIRVGGTAALYWAMRLMPGITTRLINRF